MGWGAAVGHSVVFKMADLLSHFLTFCFPRLPLVSISSSLFPLPPPPPSSHPKVLIHNDHCSTRVSSFSGKR